MSKWKPLDKMRYVSKDVPRTDGPEKVSGSAKYTQDIILPGMLYGAILRSPHAHAYVKNISLGAAERHPGVKTVLDLEKYTVRYYGEEVAAVAATSPEAAEEALALIKVEYEELPYVVTEEDAMKEGAPRISEQGNVRWNRNGDKANVERILASSAHTAQETIRTQVQVHNTLETHSVVALWEEGKLKAWISTQGVHGARDDFAKLFELDQDKVETICEHMGGGFGSKFPVGVEGSVCARLAKMAGKPVKLMLPRKDEYLAVGNRPSAIMHLKLGCDSKGKITGYWQESYGTGGIAGSAGIPLPYISRAGRGGLPQTRGRADQRRHGPSAEGARSSPGRVRHGYYHG